MSLYYQTSQIIILYDGFCHDEVYSALNLEQVLNNCTNIQTIALTCGRMTRNKFHYRRDTLFVLMPHCYDVEKFLRSQQLGPDFQIYKLPDSYLDVEELIGRLPCTTTENA